MDSGPHPRGHCTVLTSHSLQTALPAYTLGRGSCPPSASLGWAHSGGGRRAEAWTEAVGSHCVASTIGGHSSPSSLGARPPRQWPCLRAKAWTRQFPVEALGQEIIMTKYLEAECAPQSH